MSGAKKRKKLGFFLARLWDLIVFEKALPRVKLYEAAPGELTASGPESNAFVQEKMPISMANSANALSTDVVHKALHAKSILTFILRTYRQDVCLIASLLMLRLAAALSAPVLLNQLLKRLENPSVDTGMHKLSIAGVVLQSDALLILVTFGVGFSLASLVASLSMQHFFDIGLKASQKIGALLGQLIAHATLEMPPVLRRKKKTGDLVNHLANDVEAAGDFFILTGDLFYSSVCITFGFVFLYDLLGMASLAGISLFVVLVPLGRKVGKAFTVCDEKIFFQKDERTSRLSQLIGAVRVIKSFCWERFAQKDILARRQNEVFFRKKIIRLESVATVLFMGTAYLSGALFSLLCLLLRSFDSGTGFRFIGCF